MRDRNFVINSGSSVIKTFWTIGLILISGVSIGYIVAHFNVLYLLALVVGLGLIVITLTHPNWGILTLIASTFAISISFSQLTSYNVSPSDFLVLALGLGLFTSATARQMKLKFSYVFPLLILYLAVAFLSSLKADVIGFYLPRLVQFSEFGLAAFIFIQLRDVFNWKSILFVLTLGGSITSIYIVYSTVFVARFSKDITIFNGNSFAFLLDLTLPVGVAYSIMFFHDPIIKWLLPFTAIMLIGDLATISRGSYTGLILGLLIVLVLSGTTNWVRIVPLFVVLLVIVVNVVPDKVFGIVTSNTTLVDFRSYIWNLAYQVFLQNPIIGIGVNNLATIHVPTPYGPTSEGDPHNFVLRLLAETGVIGLVLVLGIIILALRRTYVNFRAFRTQNRTLGWAAMNLGMMGGLVAYLVHALFDVFWVRGSGLLFWLYIGLAYALAAKYLETKNQDGKELDNFAGSHKE